MAVDQSDIDTDTYLAPDDLPPPKEGFRARCTRATKELPGNCSELWVVVLEAIDAGEQRDYANRRLMRKIDGRLQERVYTLERLAEPVTWAAKIIGYTILTSVVVGTLSAGVWLITAMGGKPQ